jgi:hypothetical protein
MSSPNGELPYILYDLMGVADFRYLMKPLRLGKRKRVYFDEVVQVYDIISRGEIMEHNLKSELWWNGTDYMSFQMEASIEIQRFMIKFPGIDYLSARRIVWNPHYNDLLETINE